jgi:retrotransposon gag protein/zinc knuckle protein
MNTDPQQMLAQIEQLQQQLHSLQASKDRAKLAPPQPFEGRVNSNVLTWLVSVESYLYGCSTPRERWPVVASTYLKNTALDWYHGYFRNHHGPMTWDSFKAALLARFRPVDSDRIGRGQLMELRMRSSDKGRGILQYVDRFNQLVNLVSDITEKEKFAYFNKGLTPDLQRLLIPLTHINTVEEAISMVVRYEMLNADQDSTRTPQHNRPAAGQRYNAPASVWSTQRTSTFSSTPGTSAPMDLGALSAGVQHDDGQAEPDTAQPEQLHAVRSERLTPEQVEQHRRRGLCFNCHQQGHLSRQCPLKGAARR